MSRSTTCSRASRLLCRGSRCVVGLGHDGAVGRFRRLRELHVQFRPEPARFEVTGSEDV